MKKVSVAKNEKYQTLNQSKIIHLNANQTANFLPFKSQNRLLRQEHSLQIENRIMFEYGGN